MGPGPRVTAAPAPGATPDDISSFPIPPSSLLRYNQPKPKGETPSDRLHYELPGTTRTPAAGATSMGPPDGHRADHTQAATIAQISQKRDTKKIAADTNGVRVPEILSTRALHTLHPAQRSPRMRPRVRAVPHPPSCPDHASTSTSQTSEEGDR